MLRKNVQQLSEQKLIEANERHLISFGWTFFKLKINEHLMLR